MIFTLTAKHVNELAKLENDLFDHSWSLKQLEEHLNSGSPIWGSLNEDGEITGYLIASEVVGEWEIYRIAVTPSYRRQGVGKALLKKLETEAKPGDSLFLEVRSDNEIAQALYKKNGFQECGRRTKYYNDGEDAVLMMKSL